MPSSGNGPAPLDQPVNTYPKTHPSRVNGRGPFALLLAGLAVACATTGPPASLTTPPPRAAVVPPPVEAPPPTPPEVSAPVAPPIGPRLAWVNPARCLNPCTYDPSPELVRVNDRGLRDRRGAHRVKGEVAEPLRALMAAGLAAGHRMRIDSAFRSYAAQAGLFASITEAGRAARPGHSEHQLGTAVDLRLPLRTSIDWLASQAPSFGFVVSYPPGKQRITGYRPEPWHVRHVGREIAEQVARSGISLEEFFRARPELGESGSCAVCPEPVSQAGCPERVDQAGSCEGTVLTWCYEGARAAVDCASSGQLCGRNENSGEHDCLEKPPAEGALPDPGDAR
jgi:zinc D-Ala-D-Ala carboxypeptidase